MKFTRAIAESNLREESSKQSSIAITESNLQEKFSSAISNNNNRQEKSRATMLRAPVVMRHRRQDRSGKNTDTGHKMRRRSSQHHRQCRRRDRSSLATKDTKVSLRDAFYIQVLSCCSRLKTAEGEDPELYITVQITERKENSEHARRVFYKDDQSRFPHRYTLKLRTASKYNINVGADPAQELSYVKVGGCRYEEFRIINNPGGDEEEKTIYNFIWSTKRMGKSGKKYRTVVPCVIKFQGYKEIKFEIMVKFYKREDKLKHCKGVPLTSLVLSYTMEDKQLKSKHLDIQFH